MTLTQLHEKALKLKAEDRRRLAEAIWQCLEAEDPSSLPEAQQQGLTQRRAMAGGSKDRPWMAYAGIIEGEEDDSSTVDEVVYGARSR